MALRPTARRAAALAAGHELRRLDGEDRGASAALDVKVILAPPCMKITCSDSLYTICRVA